MKVAIIMGFSYLACKLEILDYKLPGIVLDLYTAYCYAQSIKCDRILVVTDHADLAINKPLFDLMFDGVIDASITDFFSNLKKNKQLLEFSSMENLYTHLREASNEATRLFFYYSGHAHDGMSLIPKYRHHASYDIPNESTGLYTVNLIDIMTKIIEKTNPTAEIFCIMDCCSSKGLFLPYKFSSIVKSNKLNITIEQKEDLHRVLKNDIQDINGEFRLISLNNCGWYGNRNVVCVSASNSSFSSHIGSKFTLQLFKLLKDDDIRTYTSLIFLLNNELLFVDSLFSQVNSSYPNSYIIQPWIKNEGTFIIKYNHTTHTINIIEN